eukprot:7319443-Alexandrium_andersonii.AAC.1
MWVASRIAPMAAHTLHAVALYCKLAPLEAWPCCHDVGRVARLCCDCCTLVDCCRMVFLPHAGCAT